jgi:hypothetical protein
MRVGDENGLQSLTNRRDQVGQAGRVPFGELRINQDNGLIANNHGAVDIAAHGVGGENISSANAGGGLTREKCHRAGTKPSGGAHVQKAAAVEKEHVLVLLEKQVTNLYQW